MIDAVDVMTIFFELNDCATGKGEGECATRPVEL